MPPKSEVSQDVGALIERARAAQVSYAKAGQEVLDEAVAAVAWAILEPSRNRQLAERAVKDTGLGNVPDKILKNHRKTLGLLRDLHGVKTTGVVARDRNTGITEIARPVGVVAAVTPSTNPSATPANNIINALKCGNAVIVAPSPKGVGTAMLLLEFIYEQFDLCGLPRDLVQVLPAPINKETTAELMRQADLVVATGSRSNVHMAYTCGTPAFGVGVGNVVAIIDETADIEEAARKIARSKTFDNATSCSSENHLVILDAVYDAALDALEACGAVLLDEDEKSRLQKAMWPKGTLSSSVVGKDAGSLVLQAGLDRIAARQPAPTFLLVTETGIGEAYPYSGEKLSPVLTIYRARNFNEARDTVRAIYGYMGAGHSVGLHSAKKQRALVLGETLPVSRVIVNQSHCFATGGNFDNGLPFSLSMGCGTWGGNNFSENMHYRQFQNLTRVSVPIVANTPSEGDLLGTYFRKYGR
ncbi:acylating sulfoacetaldehyde dehydrogenase [Candidimonas humi]|uniref:Aldehyde dehydrogenase family protein n=1 Tax=Candidimonas humi TaxID=683355 RepID=A0ABV8P3X2_9BURK|nr:aldehyde dehydrogenase family protein [Candidimonas humi]